MTIQELLKKYESMLDERQKKALSSFVDLEAIVADLRQVLNDLRPMVSKEHAFEIKEVTNDTEV